RLAKEGMKLARADHPGRSLLAKDGQEMPKSPGLLTRADHSCLSKIAMIMAKDQGRGTFSRISSVPQLRSSSVARTGELYPVWSRNVDKRKAYKGDVVIKMTRKSIPGRSSGLITWANHPGRACLTSPPTPSFSEQRPTHVSPICAPDLNRRADTSELNRRAGHLPLCFFFLPSSSMSDHLSDVSTPSDMHHIPGNQALTIVIIRKERLTAKRTRSSVPPPFLLPADADHGSSMKASELASFPTRFQCPDYQFTLPTSRDRPFDQTGVMVVYEDSLRLGFHLPICPYYQQFLDWFQISLAQLTPNSWGLIAAFGSLCHRLGFAPNARSFCELFTLKAVYKAEPCGFHSLSSRQNFGLIKGLSSKISFHPRWCWVSGPGITENPEWKGSQSNIAIEIFAREEEIF
ncbi:hypothetical protein Dimus_008146, partial [Dionaea muscipula]